MQAITVFMSLNICLCAHKQGFVINQCVISRVNVLSHSYYCCQRVFACANRRSMEEKKKTTTTRVRVRENLFPTHARTSAGQLLIEKKRAFSALCPLWLHWGFPSQVTAFLSHVLAEQSARTFHQSAGRDGSSGIILTVGPARMGLDAASQTDTRTSLSQERFFFSSYYYYYKTITFDGMACKQ